MTVLRVCYKNGAPFDEKYYYENHIPMAGAIMGSLGLKKTEIVKVSGSVPGFSAPYQFVFSAYFDSAADLQKCMSNPRIAGGCVVRTSKLYQCSLMQYNLAGQPVSRSAGQPVSRSARQPVSARWRTARATDAPSRLRVAAG